MSDTNEILVHENGKICTLSINRPEKRNALTPDSLLRIEDELTRLAKENTVRCVVLRGAGEKAFSSGYDISAIGEQKNEMMRDYYPDHPLIRVAEAIESFPYPVIAMINGHAFGAGLEIAITCDIRIAVDRARFAMPPAKLGIIYTYTGIRRFLNLIGIGYTKELFLAGRTIDSKRAQDMGLLNYVASPEELEGFTYELAAEISENAPLSMKTMKTMINSWQLNQLLSPNQEERIKELIMQVEKSEDYKEGRRAFAEKRKPVFKGK